MLGEIDELSINDFSGGSPKHKSSAIETDSDFEENKDAISELVYTSKGSPQRKANGSGHGR